MVNRNDHVIAQIVKSELAVCAVCYIAVICGNTCLGRHIALNAADGQTKETMNFAHPCRVTRSKVFIDGNNMHALAGECIKIRGQRCNKCFAFARSHFGNSPLMQHDAAYELNIIMPLPDGADGSLANNRKSFRQKLIKRFALRQSFTEFHRLVTQFRIGKFFYSVLKCIYFFNKRLYFLYLLRARVAQQSVNKAHLYTSVSFFL